MIRTAIVDDEPLAVELLADYVQKTEGLQLVEATTDVFSVLKLVQQQKADLVLLDIQMPALTGIQFMKIVEDGCKIILTTAYTEYALESYDYNVVDYLLKPISYDRFLKAIKKTGQLSAGAGGAPVPEYIFIKSAYKLIKVTLAEILYIASLRDYIAVHTADGKKIMSLESLRNMEALLPSQQFSRIHKSYIVADAKITAIEKNILSINDQQLPIGYSYQKNFFEKLGLA